MRRAPLLLACVLALTVIAAACGDERGTGPGAGRSSDGRLAVVATTSIVGDFVQQVGGDRVDVRVMLKPNVDAHDYEPSPADLEAMRSAAVIVRNGVGLEAWFDDTIKASGSNAAVVDTSIGVEIRDDDPHIWHDPTNAVVMVANIADALRSADPDGAATYDANQTDYTGELNSLDAEITTSVATLTDKRLVTNHDAFGYYAARYGFDIVGAVIPSFDSSAELSAKDLDALVRTIRQEGVRAVFAETTLPGDAARTIANEAGVTVVTGEQALYGDSLGAAGSDTATYLGMMRHNTDTIVSHLK